jgi:hypothetical protein
VILYLFVPIQVLNNSNININLNQLPFRIEVYLPPSDSWYFFINYELQKKSEKVEHFYLEKDEIGVFIKAGSILPRKFLKRLSSL